jgi:hypothetical protein
MEEPEPRGEASSGRKRTTSGRIDVLAWPSAPTSTTCDGWTRGWALGWWTSSSWSLPLKTVVIAGILQTEAEDAVLLSNEYHSICERIKSIQENCCFCCACSSAGSESPSGCAGCTRRLCFEDLCVIAFVDHERSLGKNISLPVPLIHVSEGGLPRFVREHENVPSRLNWRQVLVYENINNSKSRPLDGTNGRNSDFCLFQSKDSPPQSYFSRDLLARLTHAQTVADTILEHKDSPLASPDAHDEKLQSFSALGETKEEENNETSGDDSSQAASDACESYRSTQFFAFLIGRSLFLSHLRSASFTPLLTLADSFKAIKRNASTTCSPGCCPDCKRLHVLKESHYEMVAQYTTSLDRLVVASIDWGIGILLGLTLVFLISSGVASRYLSLLATSNYLLLYRALDWLERFPIGFKLNVRLTESMGNEIRSLIGVHEWCWERLTIYMGAHQSVAAAILFLVSSALGGSGLIALTCDVWRLSTLHLSLLAFGFRRIFAMELYLLSALWRLFRGKKRNVLRQRTDTMEYDSMQLLLGTIMFTIALFMLTTVLVYHAFFAVLNLTAVLVAVCFTTIYVLLRRFPWGRLWLLQVKTHWFVNRLYLEDVHLNKKEDGTPLGSIDITRLRRIPTSAMFLVSEALAKHGNVLSSYLSASFSECLLMDKESVSGVAEQVTM